MYFLIFFNRKVKGDYNNEKKINEVIKLFQKYRLYLFETSIFLIIEEIKRYIENI